MFSYHCRKFQFILSMTHMVLQTCISKYNNPVFKYKLSIIYRVLPFYRTGYYLNVMYVKSESVNSWFYHRKSKPSRDRGQHFSVF